MASHHRDGERTLNSLEGLGSIHSCLDGVPFKIGPKFKPPERIHVSPELLKPVKCALLDEQYSFETELGVLEWIRAKEEGRRIQKLEAEERHAKELEEFTKAGKSDSESEDNDDDETNTTDAQSNINTDENTVPKQPIIPNFNCILTPTPFGAKANTTSDANLNKTTALDLSMFEREKDAFDDMDLKTINEKEELKNVFEGTNSTISSNINNTNSDNNSNVASKLVAKPRKTTNNVKPVISNNVDDGDYISLQVDLSQNRVHFNKENKENVNTSSVSNVVPFGGQLSSDLSNSQPYKPVLPPIQPVSQFSGKPDHSVKPTMNGLNGVNPHLSNVNMFTDQTAQYSNLPQNSYLPPVSVASSRYSPNNVYENVEPRLRSARSNPDLSESPPKISVSPRFSMSNTPPPIPSRPEEKPSVTYENWNLKQRPVPPLPPVKPSKPCEIVTSRTFTPPETDPYSSLSIQDQIFVNKLGSMGFPRARVSRAVAKLGQDEKQVIDHLCHVDSLIGKGFNATKSESALFLFGNNIEKASSYIEIYSQFQELGFNSDKIREALIKNNVDRDKALDELMAS